MLEGFFDLAGFPKDPTSIGTFDIKKFFGVTLPNIIYNNDSSMDVSKLTETTNIQTKNNESVLKNDWKKGPGNLGDRLAQKQAACQSIGNGDQFDHLTSLASSQDTTARLRCGWVYNNTKPENGRGAFGNAQGPIKTDTKGTWMWNLNSAKQKYHTAICKGVQGCEDIDSTVYKQRCGWCVKSGKAVPISNGGAAYPYNTNTACPANRLITKGSKCPPPRPLDDPNGPRGPGEVCVPLQNGALPRDCLIQKLTATGCSDRGTLYQALKSGSDNDYTNVLREQQAYRIYQERATMPLDATALKTGKITISDALDNFKRVQDQASSDANGGLQYAARDLCLNKGAIEEFDFCSELQDSSVGPFTSKCIVGAIGAAGGQIGGRNSLEVLLLPSTNNAQVMKNWNSLGNWAAVKAKIREIKALTDSTNRGKQENAMLDFYGIRLQNKRNPLPDGPEIAWKGNRIVTSCQRPLPTPEGYDYTGCVDDESDDMIDKWAERNGFALGTPPPPPYKTINAYDFGGNDIKCVHAPDAHSQGGFGSEASFGKPRRECDADPNCVSHNEFYVNGTYVYCLKHNSSNGGNPFAGHPSAGIRIHVKNPRQCKAPFANPPEEVSGWKYRGCWRDNPARALPTRLPNTASTEECIANAKARGYDTVGRQYYGECWAAHTVPSDYKKYGDPGCCEAMGGTWTQQVYSVKTKEELPLQELQGMWENAGCTSKLQESQVAWWRKSGDTNGIQGDMNAYGSLTKDCTGNDGQHQFCRPGKCKTYDAATTSCINAVKQTGFIPRVTWGTTPAAEQKAVCDDLLCPYFKETYGGYDNVPQTYKAEADYCKTKG